MRVHLGIDHGEREGFGREKILRQHRLAQSRPVLRTSFLGGVVQGCQVIDLVGTRHFEQAPQRWRIIQTRVIQLHGR